MKKRYLLLGVLLAVLLLSGCTRELNDAGLALSSPEETVRFTGTVSKGMYTGTVTGGDWRFEGTLTAERLLTGEGENIPCSAALFGSIEKGSYTGSIVSGLPEGEGMFALSSGASFTGEFSGGSAVRGEAQELPWSLHCGSGRFSGTYTGPLESAGPEGNGRFAGTNDVGQKFGWNGGWKDGVIAGDGTLTDEHCVISVEGRETAGVYTGDGRDALPNGEGTFSGETENGVPFTYTGEWNSGLMDGTGTLTYDAENLYIRTGTFSAGRFSADHLEKLISLGTCEPIFTLTDEQLAFLRTADDLWEREDHQAFFTSAYRTLRDRRATIARCFSDDSFRTEPYWMEIYSLRVLTARTGTIIPGGADMTYIFAYDRSFTYPCVVIVPGHVDRLRQGNPFHVYAVPLAVSPYVNTLGETRECLVLLAGDIYMGM